MEQFYQGETLTAPGKLNANFAEAENKISENMQKLDGHKNQAIYHAQNVLRNISLTGIQRITTPFKPKNIKILLAMHDSSQFSVLDWSENEVLSGFGMGSGGVKTTTSPGVYFFNGTYAITANISNVTTTGFDLVWSIISGTPSGTVQVFVTSSTH